MDNTPTKPVLASPRTAEKLLDLYFLDMRSALLETAATLDRIERAENGSATFQDPRIRKLVEACDILKEGRQNRAEQFLNLFSDPMEKE